MRLLNLTKLVMLVLAVSLMAIPFYGQAQQQRPDQSQPAMGQQQAQSFSGKIVKSGSDYSLKDETTSATYKLDAADQAKQFVGKDVKVTGTLDPSTNTIHVERIELVTPPGK